MHAHGDRFATCCAAYTSARACPPTPPVLPPPPILQLCSMLWRALAEMLCDADPVGMALLELGKHEFTEEGVVACIARESLQCSGGMRALRAVVVLKAGHGQLGRAMVVRIHLFFCVVVVVLLGSRVADPCKTCGTPNRVVSLPEYHRMCHELVLFMYMPLCLHVQ